MNSLIEMAEELGSRLGNQIDLTAGNGKDCWVHYKEMALTPVESPGSDSLLITFGYHSIGREQMVLKLVRQLLLGTDDEIIEGAQVQCLLKYDASSDLQKLSKQLKELTRLGSWAFPTPEAYLTFADGTPALQQLLAANRPVAIDIKIENLLL